MEDKALSYFVSAWNTIKGGNFFDEGTNSTFEYMIKNLWKTPHIKRVQADIINHLPALYEKSKGLENPPPFVYILISLKDERITKVLQELSIMDFIKSNASEESTYQLMNLAETFSEKGIPITTFINAAIKNTNQNMNKDMVEALAYMTSIKHPEFLRHWLKKFLELNDNALLKNFVNMVGRRALLELMNMKTPGEVQKLLK